MAGPDFQVGQSFVANEPLKVASFRPTGAMAIAGALEEGANQLDAAARFYQADQDKLAKFQSLTALDNAQTLAAQRLEQMKVEAKPGAFNLTKDYKEERDKIFAPVKQQFPAKLKAELDYQSTQMENNLAQQAFSTEMSTRDKYYKDTLDKAMSDKLTSIDVNPDNFWESRRSAMQMIDAAGITTTDKEHYLRTWEANSQIALFNKTKEIDPEKAVVALGGKVKITNPDKLFVIKKIRDAANTQGLSDYADIAVAVAAQESNFKVDATSPTTGVMGIFQLDESSRKRHGYRSGVDGNIEAGLGDMRERIDAFKKDFGRWPTANEYYVYHYQGIGGGKAILKADPNASMFDTLAKSQSVDYANKVFRQNPWLNPQSTNAEYIAWSNQVINNRLYQTGGVYNPNMDVADPTFKSIPYDKRIQLRNSAETEFKQKEDTDYRISHNLEAEVKDRTFNEAVTLFRDDKLTPKYIDEHAQELGPQNALHLDNLLKADDRAANYSPDVHSDLLSRAWAVTNPADATQLVKDAMRARADKAITKEDYSVIQNLVNKAQSDGIARRDLVGINSEAIRANFVTTTRDPQYGTKAKASALGDVEYKRWALENPNASTEDHSKKVAEIIRGAKLQSIGLTPSTNLRTIVPILGDRTPQNASEADLYTAMSTLTGGKTALLVKQRSAKTNEERADLSKKVLALNTQGQRIKDILEWKGTPFDTTLLDQYNKPKTSEAPAGAKPATAADPKPAAAKPASPKTTPAQREAESTADRLNVLSEDFFTKQHNERRFSDPAYSARVMREELEQQYYEEERAKIKTEFAEEMKTTAVEDAFTVRTKYNNLLEERASKRVKDSLETDKNYQAEIGLARRADEVYTAEYLAAKQAHEAKGGLKLHSKTYLDNQFKAAGKKAKRAFILSERQR